MRGLSEEGPAFVVIKSFNFALGCTAKRFNYPLNLVPCAQPLIIEVIVTVALF